MPTATRGPRHWIVSRALCRYVRLTPPPGLSTRDRDNALSLMVAEAAPFEAPDYLSQWDDGTVGVWLWDRAAVEQAIRDADQDPDDWLILPETAIRARLDDGVRLARMLDGFEGQVWVKGNLRASRYWTTPPSATEWMRFVRTSGIPTLVGSTVPEPAGADWLDRPWPRYSPTQSLVRSVRGWPATAAVVGLFILPFAYQAGVYFSIRAERLALDEPMAAAEARAAPVVRAREQALRNEGRIRQIFALDPYPGQLDIMARVTERLPRNGTSFNDWIYQNGDLRFTLAGGQGPTDPTFLVRTMSEIPIFTDVNIDTATGPGQLGARMKVKRTQP